MFHLFEDDDSDDDEYRDEYLKLPEKLNSSKNVELLKQLALVSWMYSSKHQNSLQKKRSKLYSNTDFLANFGGLIGMFLGASLLSIVEILYFCIIQLISYSLH